MPPVSSITKGNQFATGRVHTIRMLKPSLSALAGAVILLAVGGCDAPDKTDARSPETHCAAALTWLMRQAGTVSIQDKRSFDFRDEHLVALTYQLAPNDGEPPYQAVLTCRYDRAALDAENKAPIAIGMDINGQKFSDKQLETLNIYVSLMGGG